jgi:AraC-like DNA-binding protein
MPPGHHAAARPETSAAVIAEALRRCIERKAPPSVVIAGGSAPPPQLAYMVSFTRLSVTLSGDHRVECEHEGRVQVVSLRAGDVLFVPPNCWDRPTWSAPATVLTFLLGTRQTGISLVQQRSALQPPDHAVKTHIDPPAGVELCLLDGLLALARNGADQPRDEIAQPMAMALLRRFLQLVESPTSGGSGGKADRSFHNICLYLEENFRLPITRDSVAEHFRLSPNHVSRLFRRQGRTKFNDFLTRIRVERAKFLLRHHQLTISEVAASCGFSDTAYFCRVFKQRSKLTPTNFRVKHVVDAVPRG